MRPLQVYLDSADYSVLSDANRETAALAGTRQRLIDYASNGLVEFRYSAAHICEISPLESSYTDAAERRAELLVQLCGSKCLISFDQILISEAKATYGSESVDINPFSDSGTWFPELAPFMSPVSWVDKLREAHSDLREQGFNRAARRLAKRQLFNGEKPRKKAVEMLLKSIDESMEEFLALYPMKHSNARVLSLYALGQVGHRDAEEAMLASLRDPRWMTQWFRQHMSKLSPVVAWVRDPARNVYVHLSKIADLVREHSERCTRLGLPFESPLTSEYFDELLETMALDAMANVAKEKGITGAPPTRFADLSLSAKGWYIGCQASAALVKSSSTAAPRTPKESDFVDVVHSIYLPYVDIFRADTFAANLLKPLAKPYKTTVVGRLVDLPDAIEQRLAQQEEAQMAGETNIGNTEQRTH